MQSEALGVSCLHWADKTKYFEARVADVQARLFVWAEDKGVCLDGDGSLGHNKSDTSGCHLVP